MLTPDAVDAEDILRLAVRRARRYLTDEAVIWRAIGYSHDGPDKVTGGISPEGRLRANAAIAALRTAPPVAVPEPEGGDEG